MDAHDFIIEFDEICEHIADAIENQPNDNIEALFEDEKLSITFTNEDSIVLTPDSAHSRIHVKTEEASLFFVHDDADDQWYEHESHKEFFGWLEREVKSRLGEVVMLREE